MYVILGHRNNKEQSVKLGRTPRTIYEPFTSRWCCGNNILRIIAFGFYFYFCTQLVSRRVETRMIWYIVEQFFLAISLRVSFWIYRIISGVKQKFDKNGWRYDILDGNREPHSLSCSRIEYFRYLKLKLFFETFQFYVENIIIFVFIWNSVTFNR